ncbi:CotH kinase family protein [candidate division KSB1 bacterium]|nr:CotH kinase family protein [candidate division KSB1 bacterium]RQW06520.1 MAG: T9SS C-terminal target domain-containing protein [candidate division KSB1 bacterium]
MMLQNRLSMGIASLLFLVTMASAHPRVVINEVMSANDTTLLDEDGEASDWLELFNASDSSLNLGGYGLSDDPVMPCKWIFPAIEMQPRAFLIVYTSDKNRSFSTPLHSNFKLKSAGEPLLLTAPDGDVVQRIEVPQLDSDQSFGCLPDGSETMLVLRHATPGQSNASRDQMPVTATPHLSPAAGLYDETIELTITCEQPNASIHYTLDGSEPDTSSSLYITTMRLDTTMVIRARAFSPAAQASRIVTSTFIIRESFSFPVVSLTADPYNLWDEDDGIYVKGRNASDQYPYKGANFWREWERPIHVEIFADQNCVLAEDAGVRIFGHYSVAAPFKPLAIYARKEYGAGKFACKIFPAKEIADFEVFMLRNSGNDWNRTLFRDALMHRLADEIGLPTQAYRPAILFLNGVYWGIHNLRERMNEHYIAANFNVDADAIDLVAWNYGFQVYAGDSLNYKTMRDYILTADLADPAHYRQAQMLIDTDNYIDYFIVEIYCNNRDWPGNNQYMWRPKWHGRWMWLIKDMDHGFGYESYYANNTLYRNALKDELFTSLLRNRTFRDQFINRFAFLLNTTFAPDHVKQIITDMQGTLEPEIGRHLARWAGAEDYGHPPETVEEWRDYCAVLYEFADKRIPYVRRHLQDHFDLGEPVWVTFDLNDKAAGRLVLERDPLPDYPWSGEFFSDVPLCIRAEAQTGYRFVGWSGRGDSCDSLSIRPTDDMTLTALFEPRPGSEIIINEINYKSASYFDVKDWVELHNGGDAEVDLSGWTLKDDQDKHCFILPKGTTIAPNGYLVLSEKTSTFRAFFPLVHNVIGDFGFGLSSQGDVVRLFDDHGRLVDVVAYQPTKPWPTKANGRGASLALITPTMDRTRPASWYAALPHGTPGQANIRYGPIEVTRLQLVSTDNGGDLHWATNVPHCGNIFRVQKLLHDAWKTIGCEKEISLDANLTYCYPFNGQAGDHALRLEYLDSDGEMRYSESVVTSVEEEEDVHFANYPNPCNGSAIFSFNLPCRQFVEIDLYNIRGQHVVTVVSDYLEAGEHLFEWRAQAPSGLYFCRVRMNDRTFMSKLTLQK